MVDPLGPSAPVPAYRAPENVLLGLSFLALFVVAGFLFLGVEGNFHFVLRLRSIKLITLLVVAVSIAVSTVVFQTITHNRILTPAIMGFDSLYVLLQTGVLFLVGPRVLASVDARGAFAFEAVVMIGFVLLLHRFLFSRWDKSLHLLALSGVVLGSLFRSLSSLLQRLIDPNEFAVLQDKFFASFNRTDLSLVGVAGIVCLFTLLYIFKRGEHLDVLALGREPAIALGIEYKREITGVLVVVAVLVSISTALVGPVTFFGLLVAHVAYLLVASHRHVLVLPAAMLLAIIVLVGGQAVLERVFHLDAHLRVIVDFIGGLAFLFLLVRRGVS